MSWFSMVIDALQLKDFLKTPKRFILLRSIFFGKIPFIVYDAIKRKNKMLKEFKVIKFTVFVTTKTVPEFKSFQILFHFHHLNQML